MQMDCKAKLVAFSWNSCEMLLTALPIPAPCCGVVGKVAVILGALPVSVFPHVCE